MSELYLVLVKENDLRLFTSCPQKIKEPIMIESEEEEQDYHGHFYHPWINSGEYREVWKVGSEEGIRVSLSIFSKEIQDLITLDKVLVINKNNLYSNMKAAEAKRKLYEIRNNLTDDEQKKAIWIAIRAIELVIKMGLLI